MHLPLFVARVLHDGIPSTVQIVLWYGAVREEATCCRAHADELILEKKIKAASLYKSLQVFTLHYFQAISSPSLQLRGNIHGWQHPLGSVLGPVETILHDLLLPISLAHRVMLEMDPGREALRDVWCKHLVDVAVRILKGVDKEMIDAVQEVELQPLGQDLKVYQMR